MSVLSTTRGARLGATADARDFKKALDLVQPAVGGRSSAPNCRCVLIEAAGDRLTITSTRLDFTIRTHIAASTWSEGAVVVPFDRLHAFASRLEGDLDLELAIDGRLLLDAGTRSALLSKPPNEFPATPRLLRGATSPLDARLLRDVLPAARARGSDITIDGKDIVAGDSEHLHVCRTGRPLPRCHLPRSAVAAIAGSGHRQLLVHIDRRAGRAQFVAGDTHYIVDLIEGPGLDPRALLCADAERDVVATVSAKDVVVAERQLRSLYRNSPPPVWAAVEAGRLTLSVTVPGVGSGSVELPAEVAGIGDDPLDIPFHPGRLVACVSMPRVRQVSIHLGDAHTPAVIAAKGANWRIGATAVRYLAPDRRALTTALVAVETEIGERPGAAELGDNIVPIERARRSRRSALDHGGRR